MTIHDYPPGDQVPPGLGTGATERQYRVTEVE